MTDARRLPSGQAIDDCRVRMTTAMEQWVLTESERGSAALSSRISADHRLRMAALLVEQMVELARVANGGDVESLDRRPPIPIRSRTQILRSQLHPQSPWLRNSLRSAFGLGVAVLVVNVTGVGHGFWVLIGVISILRYDAVGTRKFAAQAIVGTALGVVIATVVVLSVGQQEWILWVLLPPLVFLAAWSAVAVNYPVGQAAFSGLILVAFGIVAWPPQPTVGLVRIEDIALGAAVALVVGLLMWPRGAVGHLRRELASATRAGGSYLSTAIEAFSDPFPRDRLDHEHARAIDAAERASETYDIALMQRGPTEDLRPWTAATTTAYLLVAAGRVIAHFAETTRALAQHPELAACLAQAQRDSAAHWEAVAASIEANPHPVAVDEDTVHPLPDLAGIRSREDARALIIAVWVIDWVRHLDRLATGPAGSVEVLA